MTEQSDNNWPSWRYGPDGQEAIFHREEDVPEGWVDHPGKVGAEPEKPVKPVKPVKLTAAEKKAAKEAAEKEAAEKAAKEAAEKEAAEKEAADAPVTEGDF